MSLFVVAGATGHVGSVVAAGLLDRGETIRVVVRDASRGATWSERGAAVAVGSLADPEFLAKTLAGANGFFALLPPDMMVSDVYGAQRAMADTIAAAVKRSGTPLVVMLSSVGAERAEGTGPIRGLNYMENSLRATGTKLVAIRAAYFQENLANVLPAVQQMGIYPNFLPSADMAIPMVATRDIGRLAAQLLTSPPEKGEIVDLAGPEYSARQLSEKLGAALGRPVPVVSIPANQHVQAFLQAGLPRPIAEAYAEMYGALGAGGLIPKGDRIVTGGTTIDEILPEMITRSNASGR